MDPGIQFYSGMVRPVDQEMIAVEKNLLWFPRCVPGSMAYHTSRKAVQGSTRVGQEAEGAKARRGFFGFFFLSCYCGFSWERMDKDG